MEELWAEIPEFENYFISCLGGVRRTGRDKFLACQLNQAGLVYVSLHKGGKQYNRAVSPLVAGAFLDPPQHESWNTPIHLNGNRSDLYYENLMWRPRWFAVEYHQQINLHTLPRGHVRDLATGYEGTLREVCIENGLLPLRVYTQAVNYSQHGKIATVWPTGQAFELV